MHHLTSNKIELNETKYAIKKTKKLSAKENSVYAQTPQAFQDNSDFKVAKNSPGIDINSNHLSLLVYKTFKRARKS